MRMPRVRCPRCDRRVAIDPDLGPIGKGRIYRHDEAGMHQTYGGALVSCPGSLELADLPAAPAQRTLDDLEPDDNALF